MARSYKLPKGFNRKSPTRVARKVKGVGNNIFKNPRNTWADKRKRETSAMKYNGGRPR